MAEVTYYVALPFVANDDGIAAGEPTECLNPNAIGLVDCLTVVVANESLETGEVAVRCNSVNPVFGHRHTRTIGKSTEGICALGHRLDPPLPRQINDYPSQVRGGVKMS